MKRILSLVFTLLLFLAFSHPTSAKTIDIEVTEGVSVSLERYLKTSDLSEPTTVTGSFGLNNHLLFKCAYVTEEQRNILGSRYAFSENMAVMLEHEWGDSGDSQKYGFAYKFNLSDRLDLSGICEYESKDILLTCQAEYRFTELFIANTGIKFITPDQGDAMIHLLLGAEFKPIDLFKLYFDYIIPEEGAGRVYFGISYAFEG